MEQIPRLAATRGVNRLIDLLFMTCQRKTEILTWMRVKMTIWVM